MGQERLTGTLAYPANEAVHLLLHRVHGGLHNAAMSLQLAGEGAEPGGGEALDVGLVAQSGLEGIAQAARGVSLLTVLFGLHAGRGEAPADRRWVELVTSLLLERATSRGVSVSIEPDLVPPGEPVPDAERLVAMLLDGVEAIDGTPAGETLRLPRSTGATGL